MFNARFATQPSQAAGGLHVHQWAYPLLACMDQLQGAAFSLDAKLRQYFAEPPFTFTRPYTGIAKALKEFFQKYHPP